MKLLLRLVTGPGGTLTQSNMAFIMQNSSAEFLIEPGGCLIPVSIGPISFDSYMAS